LGQASEQSLSNLTQRTAEQVRQNLNALTLSLSDDTLKKMDAIWPGPSGEASEAYAW